MTTPFSFDSPGEFYLQNSLSSNDDTFRRETQNAGQGGAVPREAFVPTSIPRRDNQTKVRSVLTSLLAEGALSPAVEPPYSPRVAALSGRAPSGLTSALGAGTGSHTTPLLRRPVPTHAQITPHATNTPTVAAAAPASVLKSSLKPAKPFSFADMDPYSSDEEGRFAGETATRRRLGRNGWGGGALGGSSAGDPDVQDEGGAAGSDAFLIFGIPPPIQKSQPH